MSFLRKDTADLFRNQPALFQLRDDFVLLAEETRAPINESVRLTVRWGRKKFRHAFLVLPNLEGPALIGTDLWGKLGVAIPPPPVRQETANRHQPSVAAGLLRQTATEGERLQEFLARELPLFEQIHGPTDKIAHHIRLKSGFPIKQRYRLRNPAMQTVINQEVEKMLAGGIIEPSDSAWSSPVVIV